MRKLIFIGITIITFVCYSLSALAESPPPKFAIGLGLDVTSGSFGTKYTSTYISLPLIIDWFPSERLDFELTVPLLGQQTSGSGKGSGGMLGGDYGLGDITLLSGYAVLMDTETTPYVRPTLYAKFPTANEGDGLGTGKFDVGAGVVVSKWLGDFQPFTELRYIFQGASHDDIGAENFLIGDAGVAYSLNDRLLASAYIRSGTPQFHDMAAPFEARLKTVWRFAERNYSEMYVIKGFSDGSPKYGGGVSIFTEF